MAAQPWELWDNVKILGVLDTMEHQRRSPLNPAGSELGWMKGTVVGSGKPSTVRGHGDCRAGRLSGRATG